MFSHVMVGTTDLEKAKTFYDALLGTLGVAPGMMAGHRMFYRTDAGMFAVTLPINGEPACHANGGTIGFTCSSPEQVDKWHDTAVAHGGKSIEDPPGIRQSGAMKAYAAYVRDPDGNKLCALHRM